MFLFRKYYLLLQPQREIFSTQKISQSCGKLRFFEAAFRKYHVSIYLAFSCLIFILSISCSQPISFRNMVSGQTGHFMYGKVQERKFFENTSIQDSLKLIWSAETIGSQSNTSIVIYGDMLFVSALSGRIYVFERSIGKPLGFEKYSGSIPVAPILNEMRLFFIVNDSNEKLSTLKLFDLVGGKILSESRVFGSVQNEMLRVEDGIVLLSDSGELIKYNFVGLRQWSLSTKISARSSPASNGELTLFGNVLGEIIAVNSNNGEMKYRANISSGIESEFSIDEPNAYFGDNKGKIFSVNVSDGKLNWQFDTKNKIVAAPVHNESQIIIGNLAGDLYCLNKEDGKLIWKTSTGGVINTTPLMFKNYLVQPDMNKKVYFINTKTGKIEKTYEFERRVKLSPVFYNGILYLGADRGIINAYQTFPEN